MTVEGVADADTTRDGGAVNPTEEIVRDGDSNDYKCIFTLI